MQFKKLFAAVAVAAGTAFVQPVLAEDLTLEFVVWNYSLDTIQDNVRKFEEANPGIKVKVTDYTWPDYQDSLILKIQERHPDRCHLWRPGLAAGLGSGGLCRTAR